MKVFTHRNGLIIKTYEDQVAVVCFKVMYDVYLNQPFQDVHCRITSYVKWIGTL
jgi:hypothetical protein